MQLGSWEKDFRLKGFIVVVYGKSDETFPDFSKKISEQKHFWKE